MKLFGWKLRDLVLLAVLALFVIQISLASWVLRAKPLKPVQRPALSGFRFLRKDEWNENMSALTIEPAILDQAVIEESFLISEALNDLIDLIIGEFVDSWFTKVSQNTLFQDSIRVELKKVFRELKRRLSTIDFPSLLVFKLIPIINDHFSRFVNGKNLHDSSYSIESKLATAQGYDRGKVHEGILLSLPDLTSKEKEKAYMRGKVQDILPLLLSPKENSNETVLLLIRELLACTVLANLFGALSEGDFFNLMIVKLIGDNLQHRDRVKRLRAALQQHTQGMEVSELNVSDISEGLSASDVVRWTSYIENCESKDKLENLKAAVEKQLIDFKMSNRSTGNEKGNLLVLLSVIHNTLNNNIVSLSLETVLLDPRLCGKFRDFLKLTQKERSLDLWKAVDDIKAPLEGNESTTVPLYLEFSNMDDVYDIYNSYFSDETITIDSSIRDCVETYVKSGENKEIKLETYWPARQALFLLQDKIFDTLKSEDFARFKSSPRYNDLDFSSNAKSIRKEPSIAFASVVSRKASTNDINDTSEHVSPTVVRAVETAFEQIMKNTADGANLKLPSISQEAIDDTTLAEEDIIEERSLFGDTSSLFEEEALSNPVIPGDRNMLFGDLSEQESDSESINAESLLLSVDLSEEKMSKLEILLAAPGNLSLLEEIAKLTQVIENLVEQDAILTSLLRKAELTNNLSELKVLRKSKISLEREISSKELQKQQYIVQENENTLYGKSKVQIQSYVFGGDNISQYVLYIIEVQKFSSDDPSDITAGWVVARRFSQFYKLNEYLKVKCPQVANIRFPKKTVPVLKFQKKQIVEVRKLVLESYLQELLRIPEVCADPAFRSFLSSEDFRFGNTGGAQRNFDVLVNRFYGSARVVKSSSDLETPSGIDDKEMLENIKEMQRELKQFDEDDRGNGKVPFVKPISELLLNVFSLSNSKSWLRARALLVILQQVLGTTIEKNITQQVELNLRLEEKLLDILNNAKNLLFPNGKFRETPEARTKLQQDSTRQEAYAILKMFMTETCSKIFGSSNTGNACSNLLEMMQNDYLNKHLLFEIFDELIRALFPEIT